MYFYILVQMNKRARINHFSPIRDVSRVNCYFICAILYVTIIFNIFDICKREKINQTSVREPSQFQIVATVISRHFHRNSSTIRTNRTPRYAE